MLSREFKLNLTLFVPFLIALTLPYGNVTKIFGVEDGFSRISFSIILVCYIVYITNKSNLIIKLNPLIIIMGVSFSVTLIQVVNNNILLSTAMFFFIKIMLFIIIFTLVYNHPSIPRYFFRGYNKIFLLSLVIGLAIWFVYPVPEFVVYDGSDRRFAGLHFELFNYVYSVCLFYISWIMVSRYKIIGLCILIVLGLISKSNVFMIFLILVLTRNVLGRLFQKQILAHTFVLLIVLLPLIIGFSLQQFEFLKVFTLREQGNFDANGSSLFVRLYPYSLAAEIMRDNGFIYSLFPQGLGSFESSLLVKSDRLSFGGTGSPKAFVDIGVLLMFALCLYVGRLLYLSVIASPKHASTTALVFSASLVFISLGSGFFNIVAWFVIISWHSLILQEKRNV